MKAFPANDRAWAEIGVSDEHASTSPHTVDLDERFRVLVDRMPGIAYAAVDAEPDGRLFINHRIQEILGYPPEAFYRDRFWDSLTHPDDEPGRRTDHTRASGMNEPYEAEYRLRDSDGEWHWFHDRAVFQPGELDGPGYWLGLLVEVTDRKDTERKLQELDTRYRHLVEQLPAVTYIDAVDDDLTSLYVSPQVERILGIPADRFRTEGLWEASLHPDDRDSAVRGTRAGIASGAPFTLEYRMMRPDGGVVWVRDHAGVVRDEFGTPLYVQGLYTDITDRKEAEREMSETAAKFKTLVEQLPAVTYVDPLDLEPIRSTYVSPQIERMIGITPEEAVRRDDWWSSALHPGDRERALAASDESDTTGTPFRCEYRMVGPDERVRWVRDEATLVRNENGDPAFWLGVIYDITEQKRAEQELVRALELEQESVHRLEHADDVKNTFLTAVSHDLRTPLAAILGTAITLENEEELGLRPEERRSMTRSLTKKARRLSQLVTDLLDMDRLTRGVVEPHREPVDVGALAARLVGDSDVFVGDRVVHIDCRSTIASVDASMVERIVENLLANTAKHAPHEAQVWVRVSGVNGGALLVVEDDGPGVPFELRETLFRPFERGPSANPQSPGTGIGLSLVLRFAELHGGRAWVEDRDGGGASFRVWLPGARVAGNDPG